jgi:hypothetical protein
MKIDHLVTFIAFQFVTAALLALALTEILGNFAGRIWVESMEQA